jgi:hypothetical protein
MSIRATIRDWERDGELVLMPPVLPFESLERVLFCSRNVWLALDGEDSPRGKSNMARARATLDAYVAGKRIAVRLPPSKNVKADLALLDDPLDEIWEFRCTSAKPQIRVFGRFAEQDLFIALIMRTKNSAAHKKTMDM